MHAPRGHFVERFRWFQFLREHHRFHHDYQRCNFNVLLPLPDLCFGTLVTPFIVTFNNHTVATFSALFALYAAVQIWYGGEQKPAAYFWAGLVRVVLIFKHRDDIRAV